MYGAIQIGRKVDNSTFIIDSDITGLEIFFFLPCLRPGWDLPVLQLLIVPYLPSASVSRNITALQCHGAGYT